MTELYSILTNDSTEILRFCCWASQAPEKAPSQKIHAESLRRSISLLYKLCCASRKPHWVGIVRLWQRRFHQLFQAEKKDSWKSPMEALFIDEIGGSLSTFRASELIQDKTYRPVGATGKNCQYTYNNSYKQGCYNPGPAKKFRKTFTTQD